MHFSFVASSCDYSSAIICGCTHSSQRSRPGNEFLAEWDNQRTVCAPLLSAERREASQSVPEKKNITGDLSQTGCTEHRSTKGICLKTCTQHCRSCLGVFVKGKKTVKIKAVFSWSVQEKSYLLVKRWAKAGVAVETSLITARLRDVLLKCWEPQIKSLLSSSSSFCTWLPHFWIPLCPPAVSSEGNLGPPSSNLPTGLFYINKWPFYF